MYVSAFDLDVIPTTILMKAVFLTAETYQNKPL